MQTTNNNTSYHQAITHATTQASRHQPTQFDESFYQQKIRNFLNFFYLNFFCYIFDFFLYRHMINFVDVLMIFDAYNTRNKQLVFTIHLKTCLIHCSYNFLKMFHQDFTSNIILANDF